ncbi:MAG: hypothetical protein IJ461_08725 [Clostridia bacterium]|nr:hypothetical protein [Clostridia bacterium]
MRNERLMGNTNTSFLKILALVFMCFDHFGKMIFPQIPEMRMIGRLAFPIYCWCMVVGACYTRNIWKYGLRLLGVGLVSQPLYMVALNHTWKEPNIFLTLFIGLMGLAAIRARKGYSHIWGPVLALSLAQLLGCDYGWRGVMLIFLLYLARKERGALCAVMISFCLFWGSTSSTVRQIFGWTIPYALIPGFGTVLGSFVRLQGLAILALPFIVCPIGKPVKMSAWVSYALYPAHLLILWIFQLV